MDARDKVESERTIVVVSFITDRAEKERIAASILSDLPNWFGLPASIQRYISESLDKPLWAFLGEDSSPKGFIVLKETSESTAEIYVMGVLREYHHRGIGTALWQSFLAYAKEYGYEYIQVKTVQTGRCREYDLANRFYQSLGFRELEVFPTLWDERNPCQVYVKYIG